MKIGYVRVSTIEQNEARQIEAMKTDGVEKIYMDKKSGKDFNRPEYQKMIASLHKGDLEETTKRLLLNGEKSQKRLKQISLYRICRCLILRKTKI